MSNDIRLFDRLFVHILAASVIAGFSLQTEWAMDHGFESFDIRVFSSALAIFVLMQAFRMTLWRLLPDPPDTFDSKYAEIVLLVAVIPCFGIISNTFLRIAAFIFYTFIVLRFASETLEIGWSVRLRDRIGRTMDELRYLATGKGLKYSIENDLSTGVLQIAFGTKSGSRLSASEVKSCLASLYQDLPDANDFNAIEVSVGSMEGTDKMILPLLNAVLHYAMLMNIEKFCIVGPKERIDSLSPLLPPDTCSFEYSDKDIGRKVND